MMKKLASILLVFTMLAAFALTGCTGSAATSGTTQANQTDGNQTTKAAADTTQSTAGTLKKVSYLCGVGIYATQSNDLPVYQALQKATGIEIEWDLISSEDYTTALATRLAAGDALPDMISMGGTSQEGLSKYLKNGIIIAMDDYMTNNAPQLNAYFTENNGYNAISYKSIYDSKIVAAPSEIVMATEWQPGLCYNKLWMDKLGITDPKTIDDFYNMLVKFKTGDPNGNGTADEIPFTTLWGMQDLLGNAYGLTIGANGSKYQAGSDGKVTDDRTDARYKEYLTFMNKLYKEKLLDTEYETISQSDQLNEKIGQDRVGVVAMYNSFVTIWNPLYKKGDDTVIFYPAAMPAGPRGDNYNIARYPSAGYISLSKDCRDPALAMSLIETLLFSKETNDIMNWGIEGVSFEIKNGEKSMLMTTEEFGKIGGGQPSLPHTQSAEAYDILYQPYTQYDVDNMRSHMIQPFMTAPLTAEETERFNKLQSDVDTYYGEMKSKFISGTASLDEFDSYVSTINEMGATEMLAIKQAAYDRLKK